MVIAPPTSTREPIAGPSSPTAPFPFRISGPIIKGFGRGSSSLGIPTANIPVAGLDVGGQEGLESGVYYGYAGLKPGTGGCGASEGVWQMVMSIGWNPFYKNERRSVEVHILNKFPESFYGQPLKIVVLGFLRPEYDYPSLEALVEDINMDIEIAKRSLAREEYSKFKEEEWLKTFDDVDLTMCDEEKRSVP